MTGETLTGDVRGQMLAYAARDYVDDTYRQDNYIEVNVPEYNPTTPQDADHTNMAIPSGFFVNENFPVTEDIVKVKHALSLPLQKGSLAPVRFHKGAAFLLMYPTGKIEEWTLVYLYDKEDS